MNIDTDTNTTHNYDNNKSDMVSAGNTSYFQRLV